MGEASGARGRADSFRVENEAGVVGCERGAGHDARVAGGGGAVYAGVAGRSGGSGFDRGAAIAGGVAGAVAFGDGADAGCGGGGCLVGGCGGGGGGVSEFDGGGTLREGNGTDGTYETYGRHRRRADGGYLKIYANFTE